MKWEADRCLEKLQLSTVVGVGKIRDCGEKVLVLIFCDFPEYGSCTDSQGGRTLGVSVLTTTVRYRV